MGQAGKMGNILQLRNPNTLEMAQARSVYPLADPSEEQKYIKGVINTYIIVNRCVYRRR